VKQKANGIFLINMSDAPTKYDSTIGCESNEELNGKGASFRNAPMMSEPGTVIKQRIRGALVPMPRDQQ
jgi:hypothetical protein